MHTVRRTICAIPSRTVLRGLPARKATGTLLRADLPHAHSQAAGLPCGVGRSAYSTAAPEEVVPRKKKVWESVDEAVADVKSGDIVLSGGMWSAWWSAYV